MTAPAVITCLEHRYPRVLTIAGSDSGGGAGIQADLKTFSALGCYGMTAITALTAQNTQGVRSIHPVPLHMLNDQIDAVVEDIGVDAVKIGMLHSPEVVHAVAQALERHHLTKVVLDPVMVAANGACLISAEAIAVLLAELVPRASLITPNVDEAALLLAYPIQTPAALEAAAHTLLARGAHAVLLKGAHLPSEEVLDVFAYRDTTDLALCVHPLRAARIQTRNLHGAGCTLSSAIAAFCARGLALTDAVHAGLAYVRGALQAGAAVNIGQGVGPLNHGFAPQEMQLTQL